jgi:hypothetical protein
MASSKTKTTIDHAEIRAWVEAHHGLPAAVRGTGTDGLGADFDPGVLRIDLRGSAGGDELKPLSWEDWFAKFEREQLTFRYRERKSSSDDSALYKLVSG